MLSDDLASLRALMEKQINDSVRFEFSISGIPAINLLGTINDMIGKALQLERTAIPDPMENPPPPGGGNLVHFDTWKSTRKKRRL